MFVCGKDLSEPRGLLHDRAAEYVVCLCFRLAFLLFFILAAGFLTLPVLVVRILALFSRFRRFYSFLFVRALALLFVCGRDSGSSSGVCGGSSGVCGGERLRVCLCLCLCLSELL